MTARKWGLWGILGLVMLCVGLVGVLALVNRNLPTQSTRINTLSAAEKARLAEFIQVRQQVGDAVWPGWETAVMPVIVYNEAYVFLLGFPNPPDGWIKVPQNIHKGDAWELVPVDLFNGDPYYRQPLPTNGETPEAFTVRVGDQWVTSMLTQEWMTISLNNHFRADLPFFLVPIFPYQIANSFFLRGSDGYISLLAHESFHAYQGFIAPERLSAAKLIVAAAQSEYPWHDADLQDAWQTELDLLATAVQAQTDTEAAKLAQQFLKQRVQRRQAASLNKFTNYAP